MIYHSSLSHSLQGEALKTVAYILTLVFQKNLGVFKFYDPTKGTNYFGTRNIVFLEDVEFEGKNVLRNITFEEESVQTPTTASDNDQVSITIIEEEAY